MAVVAAEEAHRHPRPTAASATAPSAASPSAPRTHPRTPVPAPARPRPRPPAADPPARPAATPPAPSDTDWCPDSVPGTTPEADTAQPHPHHPPPHPDPRRPRLRPKRPPPPTRPPAAPPPHSRTPARHPRPRPPPPTPHRGPTPSPVGRGAGSPRRTRRTRAPTATRPPTRPSARRAAAVPVRSRRRAERRRDRRTAARPHLVQRCHPVPPQRPHPGPYEWRTDSRQDARVQHHERGRDGQQPDPAVEFGEAAQGDGPVGATAEEPVERIGQELGEFAGGPPVPGDEEPERDGEPRAVGRAEQRRPRDPLRMVVAYRRVRRRRESGEDRDEEDGDEEATAGRTTRCTASQPGGRGVRREASRAISRTPAAQAAPPRRVGAVSTEKPTAAFAFTRSPTLSGSSPRDPPGRPVRPEVCR